MFTTAWTPGQATVRRSQPRISVAAATRPAPSHSNSHQPLEPIEPIHAAEPAESPDSAQSCELREAAEPAQQPQATASNPGYTLLEDSCGGAGEQTAQATVGVCQPAVFPAGSYEIYHETEACSSGNVAV
eukprot:gene12979-biopygen3069